MIFQAHRGVSTENPENTMPAFVAAVQQGYKIIELDVEVTKDLQFVLLHDSTINRTARHENGDLIADTVILAISHMKKLSNTTLAYGFPLSSRAQKYPFLKMFCAFRSKMGSS